MHKWSWLALVCACVPLLASAQDVQRRDAATSKVAPYESAFSAYRPYVEQPVAPWPETNRKITPPARDIAGARPSAHGSNGAAAGVRNGSSAPAQSIPHGSGGSVSAPQHQEHHR